MLVIGEIILCVIVGLIIGYYFGKTSIHDDEFDLRCENIYLKSKKSDLEKQLEYYETQELHLLREWYKETKGDE